MSLVMLTIKLAEITMYFTGYQDLPPDNNLIEHGAPKVSDGAAELRRVQRALGLLLKQQADLVVHGHLFLGSRFFVMFQTVEPQGERDHEIHTAERVLNAPVGG